MSPQTKVMILPLNTSLIQPSVFYLQKSFANQEELVFSIKEREVDSFSAKLDIYSNKEVMIMAAIFPSFENYSFTYNFMELLSKNGTN